MSSRYSSTNTSQQSLSFIELADEISSGVGITFRESKASPIHRWYPYVEGFSADYIRSRLLELGKKIKVIYDPFGGAGTTQLESSMLGLPSFFSEVNPFMAFVASTKVNATAWACQHINLLKNYSKLYIEQLKNKS